MAFDLDRAMLDIEAVKHCSSASQKVVGIARERSDKMGGQRRFGRAQRPDMEIVDRFHALDLRAHFRPGPLMPSGTPASDIQTDSLSSPTLPHKMTTETARLIPGSTHCWPVQRITKPANTTASGDRCVSRHVQIGSANVDVVLATPGEEKRSRAINKNADRSDDDHHFAVGRGWMEEAADRFGANRPDCDEQEQRIGQRSEDGSFLEAIGEAGRGSPLGRKRGRPGDDQPQDVRKIVASIGQERHGIGDKSVNGLNHDKADVEADADRKALPKSSGAWAWPCECP